MSLFHNMYLVLPDVYGDVHTGPNVFYELSRLDQSAKPNAIFITARILEMLEDRKKKTSSESLGVLLDNYRSMIRGVPYEKMDSLVWYKSRKKSPSSVEIVFLDDRTCPERDLTSIVVNAANELKKNSNFLGNTPIRVLTDTPSVTSLLPLYGIVAESAEFLRVDQSVLRKYQIEGPVELLAAFSQDQSGKEPRTIPEEEALEYLPGVKRLLPNQFVYFYTGEGDKIFARVEYTKHKRNDEIVRIDDKHLRLLSPELKKIRIQKYPTEDILGISPKHLEQKVVLEHLLFDPDIQVAFLSGGAGSGKTILAYMAAVFQTIITSDMDFKRLYPQLVGTEHKSLYDKIILLKADDTLGGANRYLGFQKGNLMAKLDQSLRSFKDAHDHPDSRLRHIPFNQMFLNPLYVDPQVSDEMRDPQLCKLWKGFSFNNLFPVIELTSIGAMRGRSPHRTLILVDEVQNTKPHELQAILSRLGPGSKAILTGDPAQVDSLQGTVDSNGLVHLAKHFLGNPVAASFYLDHQWRNLAAIHASTFETFRS